MHSMLAPDGVEDMSLDQVRERKKCLLIIRQLDDRFEDAGAVRLEWIASSPNPGTERGRGDLEIMCRLSDRVRWDVEQARTMLRWFAGSASVSAVVGHWLPSSSYV